jgi:hypothetical protein
MWGQPSAVRPGEARLSHCGKEKPMKLNQQKVEDAVLAVLWLTLHEECRAWKTIDWDTMDRLHKKGFISDPARRAKSVTLTEEGLAEAKRLAEEMFT